MKSSRTAENTTALLIELCIKCDFNFHKSTVFVVSDDQAAKETVIELINGLGLEVLDVGSLTTARTIENMTVNDSTFHEEHYNWHAGYAFLHE